MGKTKAKPASSPAKITLAEAVLQTLEVAPGPSSRQVRLACGTVLDVPKSWTLLAPGDAGVTRRVKAAGPSWTVKQKKGRRIFSQGVWADGKQIAEAQRSMQATRNTAAYAKQKAAAKKRRDAKQDEYVEDFFAAVVAFLGFDARYEALAKRMADAITQHATPVGSGTVARTQRIPIQRRAESATIAWMRHQTTAYDHMSIKRVKGERREVRRRLAAESRRVLQKYRRGDDDAMKQCPLAQALRTG